MEHVAQQQEISLVLMPKNTANVSIGFLLSQCKTHQTHLFCTSCNGSLVYVPTQHGLLEHYRCLDCAASFCLNASLKLANTVETAQSYQQYFIFQTETNMLILRDFLQQIYFAYLPTQEQLTIQLSKQQAEVLSLLFFSKNEGIEDKTQKT